MVVLNGDQLMQTGGGNAGAIFKVLGEKANSRNRNRVQDQ